MSDNSEISVPFGRGARQSLEGQGNQNENQGHGQQCPPHGLGGVVSLTGWVPLGLCPCPHSHVETEAPSEVLRPC